MIFWSIKEKHESWKIEISEVFLYFIFITYVTMEMEGVRTEKTREYMVLLGIIITLWRFLFQRYVQFGQPINSHYMVDTKWPVKFPGFFKANGVCISPKTHIQKCYPRLVHTTLKLSPRFIDFYNFSVSVAFYQVPAISEFCDGLFTKVPTSVVPHSLHDCQKPCYDHHAWIFKFSISFKVKLTY